MSSGQPQPKSPQNPRLAKEVIDQAIWENKVWEYLCGGLVLAFSLVGITSVIVGLFLQHGGLAAVGVGAGALYWPPLSYARSFRQANIALRLLELALDNTKSKEEALKAINKAFSMNFAEKKGDHNVVPSS